MLFSLSQRLSAVFVVLLIAFSGLCSWLQISASNRHDQQLVQQLSSGLAAHIAGTAQLMDSHGWRPEAVRSLFDKLMAVNPSVELYLLDNDGAIVGHAATPGRLKRARVDLQPVYKLIAGADLPVLGDDPRSTHTQKVFSAAPVQVDGADGGYVYVVLRSEAHDTLAAELSTDSVLRLSLWIIGLMFLFSMLMGVTAFQLITRPLRALTNKVSDFDSQGERAAALNAGHLSGGSDEISVLRAAFVQMGQRIAGQWQAMAQADQQRRDLLANISHDLRTPLTSLHGYLETLRLKDQGLSVADRRRYLDIALGQSRKVGMLAQALFELARLESGLIHPQLATFALADVVQDVLQKMELAAEARRHQLLVEMPTAVPAVRADLAMIERVLTNLLDNAIRHNPESTRITVRLTAQVPGVQVEIRDNGRGIDAALRLGLFSRTPALGRAAGENGGLGLIIVQRMLQLHGSELKLVSQAPEGAVFRFVLPSSQAAMRAGTRQPRAIVRTRNKS